MDTMHLPPLVAMPDVPNYLGDISRSKVYELVASGELTRIRIGRRAFISGESIAGFLSKLIAEGGAA
jgi:excisionase family DNA binding protein